jgi:hypothetical protein
LTSHQKGGCFAYTLTRNNIPPARCAAKNGLNFCI